MSTTQKYALLSCLYIAQGLPFGFFTTALPVLLRNQGMELRTIGFTSILVLPWALKFLWAPALDKWGTRRGWIIVANLCAVGSLLLLSCLPLERLVGDGVVWLFGAFFILNVFSATQDIATDGLAVNLLTERERGIGNGIQVAGYRVGMILAGGVLLAWFSVLGWRYSLWVLAGLILLATAPILAAKESLNQQHHLPLRRADFVAFFSRPNLGLWLLIVCFYKFGDGFAGTMVRPLLVDLGLSIEELAMIFGRVGFAAGLAGALIGGALVNRLGRYPALLAFGLLQALALSSWALVAEGYDSMAWLYTLSALEHFVGGLATAALFTAMMDHCRLDCAASDYTIQACLVVLMTMVATALSGLSAEALGYSAHFLLAGVMTLLVLPLIPCYWLRVRTGGAREYCSHDHSH
jgi:PAT family beta-lactamase induction signal transducer AmpG